MQKLSARHINLLAYAVLTIGIAIAYSNIFQNTFLLDDEFLILKNRFLQSFSNIGLIFTTSTTAGSGGVDSFYRPLQGLIYLITYQLAGFSTAAFHIPNLLLHIANACLVYMLGMRLRITSTAAFIAALLWALHPMHTEAVTYMSATADTLYAFFCLLGLVFLLPDFSQKKIYLCCGIFILALLSKETALVFPLLVMACIYRINAAPLTLRPYLKTWPLWAIAAIYIVLRMTILKLDGLDFYKTANIYTEHFSVRLFTFLATLPDYALLILWPHDLHFDRAFAVHSNFFDAQVISGAIIFLSCTLCVITTLTRSTASLTARLFCWACFWFAGAHILHTGLFIPVNAFFLEHWMYLPSIGIFAAFSEYAAQRITTLSSHELKCVAASLVIVVAGTLGFLTFAQNMVWRNPITFYSNILDHGGENARVHNNLAMAYDGINQPDQAIIHYKRAIALNDTYAQTHYNLALILLKENHTPKYIQEVLQHLDRALEINPDFYRAYDIRAQIYTHMGDKENARKSLMRYEELLQKYHQK